jgi:alpha-amylase
MPSASTIHAGFLLRILVVFLSCILSGIFLEGCARNGPKPTLYPTTKPSTFISTTSPPPALCTGGTDKCWQNTFIYQIVTDRFDRTSQESECEELEDYCGGTFSGIVKHLDYIRDLGAEAIWISPIFRNAHSGYKGQWQMSLHTKEVNKHFGSKFDLENLVRECHRIGLMVLVSLPVNSMGHSWADIRHMDPPFDDFSNYHDCDQCIRNGGGLDGESQVGCKKLGAEPCQCSVKNHTNPIQREYCQLNGRPDLDPEKPAVLQAFRDAVENLVNIYHFDGLVFDDTMYTKDDFVKNLSVTAKVFTAGDMYTTKFWNTQLDKRGKDFLDKAADEFAKEELHSSMNWPFYHRVLKCFTDEKVGLQSLKDLSVLSAKVLGHHASQIINYVEGIDLPRIDTIVSDPKLQENILLYLLSAEGMPVILYGAEQEKLDSGKVRTPPLWTMSNHFDTTGRKYKYISMIGNLRRQMKPEDFSRAPQQTIFADRPDIFAFQRGKVLVVITNKGSSPSLISQWVKVDKVWKDGTVVCNLMWVETDCMTVQNGALRLNLQDGEGKVYAPPAYYPVNGYQCKGGDDCWKSKLIYQIITDRFACSDEADECKRCEKLDNYCGGTFNGIIRKLDYIQGLGVEAIWISPVLKNVPKGFKGYWPMSLYRINEWMGTADELHRLAQECHKRGMLFMVDVTANSMGKDWVDIPRIDPPLDSWGRYHDCTQCLKDGGGLPGQRGCNNIECQCSVEDYANAAQCVDCQLSGLPDLNQDDPETRRTLLNYIQVLIRTYGIDGIRIDAAKYMPQEFWRDFTQSAGIFGIGEVEDGNNKHVVPYITSKAFSSALNYPLFYQLKNVFMLPYPPFKGKRSKHDQTYRFGMDDLDKQVQEQSDLYGPEVIQLLGNFVSNHDQSRIASQCPDIALRKNMIMYLMTAIGMPIIYYGMEQDMEDQDEHRWNDNSYVGPMWESGYNVSSDMYRFIAELGALRQRVPPKFFKQAEQKSVFASWNMYVFTRGDVLVALTNVGSLVQPYHSTEDIDVNAVWPKGMEVCDLFGDECLIVDRGHLTITLRNGMGKIFAPKEYMPYLHPNASEPKHASEPKQRSASHEQTEFTSLIM